MYQEMNKMNKLFIFLGVLVFIPILIVLITGPMDVENEIDLTNKSIAAIDVFTINYMLCLSVAGGLILITLGLLNFKFVNGGLDE